MMTQGNRLQKIRKTLNLTQEALGDYLEVSKQVISNTEADRVGLNNDKLVSLCENFNVNLNYLLCGKGEMFNKSVSTPGSRILDIQEKNNLSDYEFAQKLNIDEIELSEIISNKREPDTRVLKNLKKIFGASMDYIMDGE